MMAMPEPKGKDALHVCSGVFLFFETVFCGTSRPEGYPMPFRCGRVSRDVPKRRVDKTSERARSAPAVRSGRPRPALQQAATPSRVKLRSPPAVCGVTPRRWGKKPEAHPGPFTAPSARRRPIRGSGAYTLHSARVPRSVERGLLPPCRHWGWLRANGAW